MSSLQEIRQVPSAEIEAILGVGGCWKKVTFAAGSMALAMLHEAIHEAGLGNSDAANDVGDNEIAQFKDIDIYH